MSRRPELCLALVLFQLVEGSRTRELEAEHETRGRACLLTANILGG